jgi:hypothetical protein
MSSTTKDIIKIVSIKAVVTTTAAVAAVPLEVNDIIRSISLSIQSIKG